MNRIYSIRDGEVYEKFISPLEDGKISLPKSMGFDLYEVKGGGVVISDARPFEHHFSATIILAGFPGENGEMKRKLEAELEKISLTNRLFIREEKLL